MFTPRYSEGLEIWTLKLLMNAFSLPAGASMGTGLHGQNGVNPVVSLSMWNVYVLHCLLYGLDILTFTKSEIANISQFHNNFLKQIMQLSDRTAVAVTYILSGQIPMKVKFINVIIVPLGAY